jgi:hypothetical protein
VSSYAGCHHDREAPIDTDNNGLLFLNSRIRFGDILDGSSYTILLGEAISDKSDLGWVSGTRATLRNTGTLINTELDAALEAGGREAPADAEAEQVAPESLRVGGFGSYHVGGAQFVLADGSVRFLTQNIDQELLQHLGHRADGQLIKPF